LTPWATKRSREQKADYVPGHIIGQLNEVAEIPTLQAQRNSVGAAMRLRLVG
jgi:hypothetical protein